MTEEQDDPTSPLVSWGARDPSSSYDSEGCEQLPVELEQQPTKFRIEHQDDPTSPLVSWGAREPSSSYDSDWCDGSFYCWFLSFFIEPKTLAEPARQEIG